MGDLVSVLQSIGYTEREAAFLYLVAVHSGYFLRRQYCRWIGRERGAIAHQFLRKARAFGHVRAIACGEGHQIYHLTARSVYEVLDLDDSPNRRLKGDAQIKRRLMMLDFVLDHLGDIFLKDEQAKLDYFTETLSIDREFLPKSSGSGKHFFDDGFPILIGSTDSNVPNLRFTFFDEGQSTTKRFERFLHDYAKLFSQLTQFELIYAATEPKSFARARAIFEKRFPRTCGSEPVLYLPYGVEHFLTYLRVRADYESGVSTLTARGILLLREGDHVYRSDEHAQIRGQWRAGVLKTNEIRQRFQHRGPRATFTALELPCRSRLGASAKQQRQLDPTRMLR